MRFDVLGFNRRFRCSIEMIKSDVIEIKRKPNQVFLFRDANNFVEALIGRASCIVYVGKDSEDSESWKAYYWEPSEPKKAGYGYSEGNNILPLGSLAILEMETEYDLEWELQRRAEETRRWVGLWQEVNRLSKRIRDVNEESKYADAERFEHMTADELEKVLDEMKNEYSGLTKPKKADV